MSERIRTGSTSREGPSEEDIHRRLEGRAEVLEAARERSSALESVLGARSWKRGLKARPELVPEWLQHAPAVTEALERTLRRAELEAWPEDTPVLVAARELMERERRLSALARRRLASLAPVSGAPSLEADLPRLDALVRHDVSLALAPGEVLVFDGQQKWHESKNISPLVLFLLVSSLGLGLSGLVAEKVFDAGGAVGLSLLLLSVVPWLVVSIRSGRALLTSERLLWQPAFGEPVSVPLASIPTGGIHLNPRQLNVRVDGARRAEVRHLQDAPRLAVLLELHRQAPLRGAARAGVRLGDVVIYPAMLREGTERRPGHAVLRPNGVAFIPEDSGAAALQALTGTALALPVDPAWVLEELRWLPDREFDAWVARLVEATGGQHWSAWDARHRKGAPVWQAVHITRGEAVLTGGVDWSRQGVTERLLRSWPQGSDSGERE